MASYPKNRNYKFNYELNDIESLIEKVKTVSVKGNIERTSLFYSIIHNLLKVCILAIDKKERELLSRIVSQKGVSIQEIDQDKIQPLVDITLVKKNEEKDIYQVNGELLEFVINNIKELDYIR